jgi:hypothetical protein
MRGTWSATTVHARTRCPKLNAPTSIKLFTTKMIGTWQFYKKVIEQCFQIDLKVPLCTMICILILVSLDKLIWLIICGMQKIWWFQKIPATDLLFFHDEILFRFSLTWRLNHVKSLKKQACNCIVLPAPNSFSSVFYTYINTYMAGMELIVGHVPVLLILVTLEWFGLTQLKTYLQKEHFS